MSLSWYLVRTKVRQEVRALDELHHQGYATYFPKFLKHILHKGRYELKEEALFPRYIFIQLSDLEDDWGPIRSTRGCDGLVHFGHHYPKISQDEFFIMQKHFETMVPEPIFKEGDWVEVKSGPFRGHQGFFKALQQCLTGIERAYLLLDFFGKQQKIAVALSDIRVMASGACART